MGLYEGAQKVVVGTNIHNAYPVGLAHSHDTGICSGAVYLCFVLILCKDNDTNVNLNNVDIINRHI